MGTISEAEQFKEAEDMIDFLRKNSGVPYRLQRVYVEQIIAADRDKNGVLTSDEQIARLIGIADLNPSSSIAKLRQVGCTKENEPTVDKIAGTQSVTLARDVKILNEFQPVEDGVAFYSSLIVDGFAKKLSMTVDQLSKETRDFIAKSVQSITRNNDEALIRTRNVLVEEGKINALEFPKHVLPIDYKSLCAAVNKRSI